MAKGPAPGRPKPDRAPRGQERSDWGLTHFALCGQFFFVHTA
jgi:hypothetical protein